MSLFFYYPLGGAASSALKIKVRPNPAEKYSGNPSNAMSIDVKAYVSGGVPPYVVNWTYLSGSTAIYPSSYTGIDVGFSGDKNNDLPESRDAIWRATVTDSALSTDFDDVTISLNFGLNPP